MRDITVPVLIAGGGGAGLTASILLSRLGIRSLLIERHPTPSPMPKARGLNRRTLEVMRQFGLEQALRERAMPGNYTTKVRWMTGLGGEGPLAAKTLHEVDAFGGGEGEAEFAASSPFGRVLVYPQVRLEPFLRSYTQQLGVGEALLSQELVEFTQNGDEVVSQVRDRGTGELYRVRSKYLIGADAGRTVGPAVGARLEGTEVLGKMITVYFRADLSKYVDDDHISTIIFIDPNAGTANWAAGALGKLGPPFGRDCQEWLLHSGVRPGDPEQYDAATLVQRIRDLLQIPDLPVDLLGSAPWVAQGLLADRYRFGRVFLVGDSAHRHPPATGLGLNSGIQDVHNLAWKLAMVLQGFAGDGLLDTYETERRPIARRNVRWALLGFSNAQLTAPALGLVPGDPKTSRENLLALLADDDEGEARRARMVHVLDVNRIEFQANDLDIGLVYEQGALVPDGTARPPRDPFGFRNTKTTRPGHRLPHAWIVRDGAMVSTLDLVEPLAFTLLVGGKADGWQEAAGAVATTLGVRIQVFAIGDAGSVIDRDHAWRRVRGHDDGGAVLVRPDHHVAWRAATRPNSPAADLEQALRQILGRTQTP